MTINHVIALILVCALMSCSGKKSAEVKYQPIYDFTNISSYGLYSRQDEFNDWQSLPDNKRNSIELAIENAMDDISMTFKSADQADVVITYFLLEHSPYELTRYNDGVNYCSYCLTHAGSESKSTPLAIQPGSLVIDVIKPHNRRSIWRASYPLNVKEKDTSIDIHDKVIAAVDYMIGQFGATKLTGKPSG